MSMVSNALNIKSSDRPWIELAINPDNPVVFLDTDRKGWLESDVGAGGKINSVEVSIVENIVQSLCLCGLAPSSIGVITPFRSQVRSSTVSECRGSIILMSLTECYFDRLPVTGIRRKPHTSRIQKQWA